MGTTKIGRQTLGSWRHVSHVDVNRSAYIAGDDYEISLQEVRQALTYCSSLQCVKDEVLKYCHNCTLRVQQDGEALARSRIIG